jgi:hypothetical protein
MFILLSLSALDRVKAAASLGPGPSESPARMLRRKASKSTKGASADVLGGMDVEFQIPSPSTGTTATSSVAPTLSNSQQIPLPTSAPTLQPLPDELPTTPPVTASQQGSTNIPTYFPSLGPSDFQSSSVPPSLIPTQSLTSTSLLELTETPSDPPSLDPSSFPSWSVSSEPSDVPSDVPSSLPIAEAFEPCNLVATVDCRLKDGAPCSSLATIPSDDVTCTDRPYELEWFYKAGSCNESSTSQTFECQDENGGPSSVFLAYITITGVTSNYEYVSRMIFQGIDGFPVQKVVIKSNTETAKPLDETIKVRISKGSPSGEVLQEMTISIACDDSRKMRALRVGDTFGALQLSSFLNNETSSMEAFVSTTWIYSAKNTGTTTSVLMNMDSVTNGVSVTISPKVTLSPGKEYLLVSHETISLTRPATFTGELTILEDSDVNECSASSNYTFRITPSAYN